jgi:hypothetical protein
VLAVSAVASTVISKPRTRSGCERAALVEPPPLLHQDARLAGKHLPPIRIELPGAG